jgi:hypothetical protein
MPHRPLLTNTVPSRAGRYRNFVLTLALIIATFVAMWLLR